ATHLMADRRRLVRAERTVQREQARHRAPLHELHPETDAAVPHVGAVHRYDVRMTNTRERLRFMQDAYGRDVDRGSRLEQLQRHLAIEPSIARAVDFAERPLPDPLEQLQMTPRRRGRVRR